MLLVLTWAVGVIFLLAAALLLLAGEIYMAGSFLFSSLGLLAALVTWMIARPGEYPDL